MKADVVKILMKRDGITKKEAENLIEECREALEEGDTEAIQEYLGLEDDYIFDILDQYVAGMAEQVDAGDLKSPERYLVWVRLPLPAFGLSFVAVATSKSAPADMNCNSATIIRKCGTHGNQLSRLERWPYKPCVTGSSPVFPISQSKIVLRRLSEMVKAHVQLVIRKVLWWHDFYEGRGMFESSCGYSIQCKSGGLCLTAGKTALCGGGIGRRKVGVTSSGQRIIW